MQSRWNTCEQRSLGERTTSSPNSYSERQTAQLEDNVIGRISFPPLDDNNDDIDFVVNLSPSSALDPGKRIVSSDSPWSIRRQLPKSSCVRV